MNRIAHRATLTGVGRCEHWRFVSDRPNSLAAEP